MLIHPPHVLELLQKFKIQVTGILHVGAHLCEERGIYNTILQIPDSDIVWVDGNDENTAKNKQAGIPNCFTAVLDGEEKEAIFHITNNGQSSSLLEFGTHAQSYPWCQFIAHVPVKTQTLSTFVNANFINIQKLNFWNFDIQGSEFDVLQGSKELLQYCDVLYTEVNTTEVYKNCGLMSQLDILLEEAGLTRVLTHMTDHQWGDAIYVRAKA